MGYSSGTIGCFLSGMLVGVAAVEINRFDFVIVFCPLIMRAALVRQKRLRLVVLPVLGDLGAGCLAIPMIVDERGY